MKSRVDVFAPQKLEVQKLARMPIFEPHPCRHGRCPLPRLSRVVLKEVIYYG